MTDKSRNVPWENHVEEKEAELSRHTESSRLTKILLKLRDRKLVGCRSAASQRRRRIITGRMFAWNFTKLPLENLRRFSRQFFPVDVTILYFRRKLRFPAKRIAIADSYTKSSSMHRNSMTLIATTISFLSGNNEEDFFQLPTSSSSNVILSSFGCESTIHGGLSSDVPRFLPRKRAERASLRVPSSSLSLWTSAKEELAARLGTFPKPFAH